jgi:hypothetical protein
MAIVMMRAEINVGIGPWQSNRGAGVPFRFVPASDSQLGSESAHKRGKAARGLHVWFLPSVQQWRSHLVSDAVPIASSALFRRLVTKQPATIQTQEASPNYHQNQRLSKPAFMKAKDRLQFALTSVNNFHR